jgi:hypothetical protein
MAMQLGIDNIRHHVKGQDSGLVFAFFRRISSGLNGMEAKISERRTCLL